MSYGAPAFKVGGEAVAGFAAAKDHSNYLPHSGSVLGELGDDVGGYDASKGSLRFAIDEPLPDERGDFVGEVRLARLAVLTSSPSKLRLRRRNGENGKDPAGGSRVSQPEPCRWGVDGGSNRAVHGGCIASTMYL